ncbi:MAG: hypothetical protein ACQEQA_00590 [Bacillota bacterium]
MLNLVLQEQKKKKNIIIFSVVLFIMYALYLSLDILGNDSISAYYESLGLSLLIIHQIVNLAMASISALMISLSQIKLNLTKSEPVGATGIPFLSFIFGLLTFGCAPCVVTFLAAVGISFTPIVLPNGNLLWKFALLALLLVGLVYILWSIEKGTCKVKPDKIKKKNQTAN